MGGDTCPSQLVDLLKDIVHSADPGEYKPVRCARVFSVCGAHQCMYMFRTTRQWQSLFGKAPIPLQITPQGLLSIPEFSQMNGFCANQGQREFWAQWTEFRLRSQ